MNNIFINLILLLSYILCVSPTNAQVFDLSSTKKFSTPVNLGTPEVYKPSKLVIGTSAKFVIKAKPQSHVSLVTSDENIGAALFYGYKLRLGQIINPHEGIVGKNGIIELEIPLPYKKELAGKILYFEVLVWQNSDYSDLEIAKIMGIDGRESDNNAVLITEPLKNTNMPGLSPGISGVGDFNKTMEIMDRINESSYNDSSDYDDEMNYINEPLIIRNLRLPETKTAK